MQINSLASGSHRPGSDDMCLMEAVAYVAGEPWSDHPPCASPVLGAFGRVINDLMPDNETRALLVPLIPRLIGTAGDGKDQKRAYMAADWACRIVAPLALEAVGMDSLAAQLRALDPVVDKSSAAYAAYAARAADAADAADDAARAAAYAASGAAYAARAARAAAYAAARAANVSWPMVVEFFGRLIDAA